MAMTRYVPVGEPVEEGDFSCSFVDKGLHVLKHDLRMSCKVACQGREVGCEEADAAEVGSQLMENSECDTQAVKSACPAASMVSRHKLRRVCQYSQLTLGPVRLE